MEGEEGGREEKNFAIVSIICQSHFGTNEDDFAIEKEDATVVTDVFVKDGHADVANDVYHEGRIGEGGERGKEKEKDKERERERQRGREREEGRRWEGEREKVKNNE